MFSLGFNKYFNLHILKKQTLSPKMSDLSLKVDWVKGDKLHASYCVQPSTVSWFIGDGVKTAYDVNVPQPLYDGLIC